MVLRRIPDLEDDRDLGINPFDLKIREVGFGLKREPVASAGQRNSCGQELPDAAVVISHRAAELAPAVFRTDFEHDGHAARRPPARGVKDVGGDTAHEWIPFKRSFSSLRLVIFRCSSAAMCSSISRSLSSRCRSRLSISAALLPVAQTMKI